MRTGFALKYRTYSPPVERESKYITWSTEPDSEAVKGSIVLTIVEDITAADDLHFPLKRDKLPFFLRAIGGKNLCSLIGVFCSYYLVSSLAIQRRVTTSGIFLKH